MATVSQVSSQSSLLDHASRMLIGGELTAGESGETLTSHDPATRRALAQFPNASPADVDRAAQAANAALPGWQALDLSARQAVVLEVATRIHESREELATLDMLDTGSPYSGMLADADGAVWSLRHFAALSHEIKGEVTHRDQHLHYTRREPFGVVARLIAFNHPLAGLSAAMAAPLLTGNCVILKPSPHTPLSGLALASIIQDVAPPGVTLDQAV